MQEYIIFLYQHFIAAVRYCLLPLILFMASTASAETQLQSNTEIATAGYFQLNWNASEASTSYSLQQSNLKDFTTVNNIYLGADTASVLSGYPDGTYYFRVLDDQGGTSNTVTVQVAHHPLSKAFGFFALGALMFIILLTVLITASRKEESL